MKRYDFPRLGEHYWEEVLENGLTIRVVDKPEFAKTYGFFATNYGSLDTKFQLDGDWQESPAGVAHYLEHKMFDMPEGNVMQMFSEQGGSPNAFTSHNITAYYVECTENFQENLNILLNYVTTPYFTPESVEKEQGIIAQEIQMYEDSPGSRLYENLFATMYEGHAMAVSIAGTVESIAQITDKTLYDCHRAFYDPSNMVLVVVGPVDPEIVVETAKKLVPPSQGHISKRDYGQIPAPKAQMTTVEQTMEVAMPNFALAFRCPVPGLGQERLRMELLGDLAVEVLIGESTPLYNKLYEEGIIDCDFSAGYEGVKDISFVSFNGCSQQIDLVVSAILGEVSRLKNEGYDQKLFDQLKKSAFGRKIRDLDSFENICYRMSQSFFDEVEYYEFPEIYQSITLEETLDFLFTNIQESGSALSIIKPKEAN